MIVILIFITFINTNDHNLGVENDDEEEINNISKFKSSLLWIKNNNPIRGVVQYFLHDSIINYNVSQIENEMEFYRDTEENTFYNCFFSLGVFTITYVLPIPIVREIRIITGVWSGVNTLINIFSRQEKDEMNFRRSEVFMKHFSQNLEEVSNDRDILDKYSKNFLLIIGLIIVSFCLYFCFFNKGGILNLKVVIVSFLVICLLHSFACTAVIEHRKNLKNLSLTMNEWAHDCNYHLKSIWGKIKLRAFDRSPYDKNSGIIKDSKCNSYRLKMEELSVGKGMMDILTLSTVKNMVSNLKIFYGELGLFDKIYTSSIFLIILTICLFFKTKSSIHYNNNNNNNKIKENKNKNKNKIKKTKKVVRRNEQNEQSEFPNYDTEINEIQNQMKNSFDKNNILIKTYDINKRPHPENLSLDNNVIYNSD